MNSNHTNVAQLWFAASKILQCTGRLHEHELWVQDNTRRFIEEDLMKHATEIADWLGCDLVARKSAFVKLNPTVTILPLDAEEEAA
jgi:hypothetical protein